MSKSPKISKTPKKIPQNSPKPLFVINHNFQLHFFGFIWGDFGDHSGSVYEKSKRKFKKKSQNPPQNPPKSPFVINKDSWLHFLGFYLGDFGAHSGSGVFTVNFKDFWEALWWFRVFLVFSRWFLGVFFRWIFKVLSWSCIFWGRFQLFFGIFQMFSSGFFWCLFQCIWGISGEFFSRSWIFFCVCFQMFF